MSRDVDDTGTHRFHVTHDYVVELDPDRLDEYVDATFDLDGESVKITDLTKGNAVKAPIVFDEGPGIQELVHRD